MSSDIPPQLAAAPSTNNPASPFDQASNTQTLKEKASNAKTLEEFYSVLGLSPPTNANEILMSDIRNAANSHLPLIGKTWSTLDEYQQAKIAFLLLRNQPSLLQKFGYNVAELLCRALDVNTPCGRRLEAFVQKGGDGSFATVTADIPDFFASFLAQFPKWNNPENAPTIFNQPHPEIAPTISNQPQFRCEKPVFGFQQESSSVCSLVSIMNLINYGMSHQPGTEQTKAVDLYALNVGKFMRNKLSDEEIFDNVYLGVGSHPDKTLERLLRQFNAGESSHDMLTDTIYLGSDISAFEVIKAGIRKYGALVIERFRLWPEFVAASDQLVFGGDWNEKDHFPKSKMRQDSVNRAFLVVGASLTGSEKMGGIELLVQTSYDNKPFVIVGYDLLLSMGVNQLLAIRPGLKFLTEVKNVADFAQVAHMMQSESPRYSQDDVEVPQEYQWSLNKPVETIVSERGCARGTMPNYWMPIQVITFAKTTDSDVDA
jgi:hypothetical protein